MDVASYPGPLKAVGQLHRRKIQLQHAPARRARGAVGGVQDQRRIGPDIARIGEAGEQGLLQGPLR